MEDNEKIRCSISVDFPREVIKEVERVQEELKKKNIFYGKFTERDNLHLTLKFLGEIDKEKVGGVKKKLREIKFNEFSAKTGDLGFFSPKFIRIVWMKIMGKEIFELQKEIDEKLKEDGMFEIEERFMSHLTIARVKSVKDKKMFLQELEKITTSKINFKVDCFYLMSSILRPEGPVYEVIEKYELC